MEENLPMVQKRSFGITPRGIDEAIRLAKIMSSVVFRTYAQMHTDAGGCFCCHANGRGNRTVSDGERPEHCCHQRQARYLR